MNVDVPLLTKKGLNALLDAIEPRIPEMHCRVIPSSFDADDSELRAFPSKSDWKWDSCQKALQNFQTRAVMMRLPLFWQMESPLHAACRSVGAPIFINEPENMPVGAAALSSAEVDTVVTEAGDGFSFSEYLSQKNLPLPRNWVIVHRSDAPWQIPAALRDAPEIQVAQEVHAFPGLPILHQCQILARKKASVFHVSDAFALQHDDTGTSITSIGDVLLSLTRFELPFTLATIGTCVCGAKTVKKIS